MEAHGCVTIPEARSNRQHATFIVFYFFLEFTHKSVHFLKRGGKKRIASDFRGYGNFLHCT